MTRTSSLLVLTVLVVASAVPASAQVTVGTPPFGSYGGGPDVINLANLNAHLVIPVLNKPGRGMLFAYNLVYDSSIWYPVGSSGSQSWKLTTASNWGWTTSIPRGGNVSYAVVLRQTRVCRTGGTYTTTYFGDWTYHDGFGTPHPFGGETYTVTGCGNN